MFCSELETAVQPQASAQTHAADGKEYTQILCESVNLNKPEEPTGPSQNKGELRRNEKMYFNHIVTREEEKSILTFSSQPINRGVAEDLWS